jgi:hypothetical protein
MQPLNGRAKELYGNNVWGNAILLCVDYKDQDEKGEPMDGREVYTSFGLADYERFLQETNATLSFSVLQLYKKHGNHSNITELPATFQAATWDSRLTPKSILSEFHQRMHLPLPTYETTAVLPFKVKVKVHFKTVREFESPEPSIKKKDAEQNAALQALRFLNGREQQEAGLNDDGEDSDDGGQLGELVTNMSTFSVEEKRPPVAEPIPQVSVTHGLFLLMLTNFGVNNNKGCG